MLEMPWIVQYIDMVGIALDKIVTWIWLEIH